MSMTRIPPILPALLLLGSAIAAAAPAQAQSAGPVEVDPDDGSVRVTGIPDHREYVSDPDLEDVTEFYPTTLLDLARQAAPDPSVVAPAADGLTNAAGDAQERARDPPSIAELVRQTRLKAMKILSSPQEAACEGLPSIPLLTLEAGGEAKEAFHRVRLQDAGLDVRDIRVDHVQPDTDYAIYYEGSAAIDTTTSAFTAKDPDMADANEYAAGSVDRKGELGDGVVTFEAIPLVDGSWTVESMDSGKVVAEFEVTAELGEVPDASTVEEMVWGCSSSSASQSMDASQQVNADPEDRSFQTSVSVPTSGEAGSSSSWSDCPLGPDVDLFRGTSHSFPSGEEVNDTGWNEDLVFFRSQTWDVRLKWTYSNDDGCHQSGESLWFEDAVGAWYALVGPTTVEDGTRWSVYTGGHGFDTEYGGGDGRKHWIGISMGTPQEAVISEDRSTAALRHVETAEIAGTHLTDCETQENNAAKLDIAYNVASLFFSAFTTYSSHALIAMVQITSDYAGAIEAGEAFKELQDRACSPMKKAKEQARWSDDPRWREASCGEACFSVDTYGMLGPHSLGFNAHWETYKPSDLVDVRVDLDWRNLHVEDLYKTDHGNWAKSGYGGESFRLPGENVTVPIESVDPT